MNRVDEDGKIWGAIIGSVVDYSLQVATNFAQGQSLSQSMPNVDVGSIVISAGAGLFSGGLSSLTKASKATTLVKAAINIAGNSAISAGEGYAKTTIAGQTYTSKRALRDAGIGTVAAVVGEIINIRNAKRLEGVAEKGMAAETAQFKAKGVSKNPKASAARKARYQRAASQAEVQAQQAVKDFWKATTSENLQTATTTSAVVGGVLNKIEDEQRSQ